MFNTITINEVFLTHCKQRRNDELLALEGVSDSQDAGFIGVFTMSHKGLEFATGTIDEYFCLDDIHTGKLIGASKTDSDGTDTSVPSK